MGTCSERGHFSLLIQNTNTQWLLPPQDAGPWPRAQAGLLPRAGRQVNCVPSPRPSPLASWVGAWGRGVSGRQLCTPSPSPAVSLRRKQMPSKEPTGTDRRRREAQVSLCFE